VRRPARAVGLALLVLLQLRCGDEGPNELTYGELEGTWPLLSLIYTSDANPSTTFDFLAAGGSGSLHFEADTTFLLILVPDPGSPSESSVGPVELDGATVILTDEADPDPLRGTLVEGRLTFETENAEYDFNEDGADEPARVKAVFVR
jgi:hypothetical protein